MKGLAIKSLKAVNPDDIKGRTYEWMKGAEGKQITICCGKVNSVYGNHYHVGKDRSKNPESVLLVSGKLLVIACNGKDTIKQLVGPFCEIFTWPDIIHKFKPLTDVIFLEYRKDVYNPQDPDTFSSESYESYLKSKNMPVDKGAIKKFMDS